MYGYLNILLFQNFNGVLNIQFRKIVELENISNILYLYPHPYHTLQLIGNFNELDISKITRPTRILNKDFYVNVQGRVSFNPSLQNIYLHILGEDVLDT